MTAFVQNEAIVRGTLAEILLNTGNGSGSYVGQRAIATDKGVGNGLELVYNGSAWKYATVWQPLALLRAPVTLPNDTAENTAFTYTLPILGANTMLRVCHFWTTNANASGKTVKVNLDATGAGTGFSSDISSASAATGNLVTEIRNMNDTAVQKWFSNNKAIFGANNGTIQGTTRQTGTAGVVLTVTGTKTTAGDVMTLEWADLWICGGG